ncbi:hypothetical protein Nocox_38315 [Nonomuraea coxensis DSM 45129]|uniref:Prolyl 4-hydroxylase alpha subunit Fe(2+) 2OG dioxygenase domain-containing protein n=1 Tax=Nonomuraea coxensis DSM 45129 TaxID=1122611 RepID=A0ABX8UBU5_9ACTN|nr:2OG-Fe(II) oxygenase [Nonomuraea coxensis]QYC45213.1 hypothetical protein Nocox_38315 [Nonomuraea coxensis DSM 45129]
MSEVLLRDRSLASAYMALLQNPQLIAAQVPSYLPSHLCEHARLHVIPQVLKKSSKKIYRSQVPALTDVFRRGQNDVTDYFDHAHGILRQLRDAFLPYANPADMLRSEIDELTPRGAQLLRLRDKPAVFGMMRSWDASMEALPHFDIIQQAHPDLGTHLQFGEQFGINIHLHTPRSGGELLVWDVTLHDLSIAGLTGSDGTYGYPPHALPPPDVVLKPNAGDLVIVRSTRLHSVARTSAGERVTISGFIGLTTDASEARLWS